MNVAEILERSARYFPKKVALHYKDRAWTFAELDEGVSRLASGFRGLGLKPGERVALFLPNCPEFLTTYYACQKAGLVPISLNVTFKRDEVSYIVRDSASAAIVTVGPLAGALPGRGETPSVRHFLVAGGGVDGAESLEGVAGESGMRAMDLDRDETAAILYTSATTGRPKGVMLTHGNLVSNTYATNHHLRMTPEDRSLCALPLFHVFGQNFIMNAVINAGATLYLHERFVMEEVVAAVSRHWISIFYGVPTMYILMLNADLPPSAFRSIRLFFSAAATMPTDISARWRERFGLAVHEGYGLTECSPCACYNHDVAFRPGSVGTAIENVELKIFDEEDRELGPGQLGEIVIKGPNVMKGYFGKAEETAKALRSGWLHSGDIGYRDEDGYFYIVDRVKDMINVSGFKVFPREVEEIFFQHPAIKEVAVVGMPDPVKGETVKAFAVLREGARVSGEELIALCRERIASYKVPQSVEFIPALPKSPTGKILKKELRGQA